MVPVLNAPVRADGAGEGLGVETDLTGVAADLLTRRPQTGCPSRRSGLEGQARNPGDAGDQRLPLGVQLVSKTSTNRCSWRRRRWLSKGWCSAQSLASVSCRVGDVVRNPGMVSFVIDISDPAVLQIGSIIWIVRDSQSTREELVGIRHIAESQCDGSFKRRR